MTLVDFISTHFPNQKEIIFYGGSFRPWHEGHKACIDLLSPKNPLIVIPDHNPLKQDLSEKTTSRDFSEIIRDLRLNQKLFTGFYDNFKKNPTYNWVNELQHALPHLKISLLMGFDSLLNIHKWYESETLIKILHQLYVVSRLESSQQRDEIIMNNIHLAQKVTFLGNHPFENISSTQIRSRKD